MQPVQLSENFLSNYANAQEQFCTFLSEYRTTVAERLKSLAELENAYQRACKDDAEALKNLEKIEKENHKITVESRGGDCSYGNYFREKSCRSFRAITLREKTRMEETLLKSRSRISEWYKAKYTELDSFERRIWAHAARLLAENLQKIVIPA